MVIKVLDHVRQCYTWEDGEKIGTLIRRAFDRKEKIILSFVNVNDAPSSFVNAAFIALLDKYDFDFIRQHLRVIDSTRQINDMIKRRFADENNKPHAA